MALKGQSEISVARQFGRRQRNFNDEKLLAREYAVSVIVIEYDWFGNAEFKMKSLFTLTIFIFNFKFTIYNGPAIYIVIYIKGRAY